MTYLYYLLHDLYFFLLVVVVCCPRLL